MGRDTKYLKGLDKVSRNLNKEIESIKGRTLKGLITASILIRKDMSKNEPTIPVDTGTLEKSWFTTPIPGIKPKLIAGFSANYAVFVHENMEINHQKPAPGAVSKTRRTKWRTGAGAKFYEASLNRNHDAILQIIRDNILIP